MSVVGVKFNLNSKTYFFDDNNIELKPNDIVLVETEKGQQIGSITDYIKQTKVDSAISYKKVIRRANKKDIKQYKKNISDADNAILKCEQLIDKYKLSMKIIDANYTFNRSQLVFRFISDARVDFRQLAKELGTTFKTRIELRQVGIRDKAKAIGGIGPCGRMLCCNEFLTEFDSVSINMAKNQSLSLNPSKINGVCGRLLCCLTYENDNYNEYKKDMPSLGKKVKVDNVEGKVIAVDLFNKKYKVLTDKNEIVDREVSNSGSKK